MVDGWVRDSKGSGEGIVCRTLEDECIGTEELAGNSQTIDAGVVANGSVALNSQITRTSDVGKLDVARGGKVLASVVLELSITNAIGGYA